MARIHGTYEYDDDGLTPGKKKEGGLHQNLFDGEGNLRGSARFIPDDEQPEGDFGSVYWDPYFAAQLAAEAEVEERRREREQQENAELLLKVLKILGNIAYEKAKPRALELWREEFGPAVQARRDARALRKAERRTRREQKHLTDQSESSEVVIPIETEIVEGTVIAPTDDLVHFSQADRPTTSSSEAQARYLMALAAKAFSDEQLRMVANANIGEDEGLVALESALVQLPAPQVAQLTHQLELNPSVLADESFDFAKLLAEAAESGTLAEVREPRRAE